MTETGLTLRAADGVDLDATLFAADSSPARAAVVVAGATGVRRAYYGPFARYLASEGMAALTFDYRGIGGSRPASLRGFPARMRDGGEKDLESALDAISRLRPGVPILLVGHSVGGQLVGLAGSRSRLAGLLLVASQSGYWGNWTGPEKGAIAFMWFGLIPLVTGLVGYFPAKRLGLGEDLPAGVALEWARWGRSSGYLLDHLPVGTREAYASFAAPLRAYSFTDDRLYAPRGAVAHLLSFFSSAPKEWLHLRPGERGLRAVGHFGFFRSPAGAVLWPDAARWLHERG